MQFWVAATVVSSVVSCYGHEKKSHSSSYPMFKLDIVYVSSNNKEISNITYVSQKSGLTVSLRSYRKGLPVHERASILCYI